MIPRTAPQRAVEEPHAPAVRAGRVPETAAAHGCRRLVPGARAAGVFRDDPAHAAAAFRSHPEPGGRFAGAFAHVVFGVLDRTRDSAVRTAFERTSADLPSGPTAISSSRTAPQPLTHEVEPHPVQRARLPAHALLVQPQHRSTATHESRPDRSHGPPPIGTHSR
ncbi:hypothetical protein GCM10023238_00450 [Streptomyces heliomycini]